MVMFEKHCLKIFKAFMSSAEQRIILCYNGHGIAGSHCPLFTKDQLYSNLVILATKSTGKGIVLPVCEPYFA